MKKNFLLQNISITPITGQMVAGSIIGILVFFILLVFQPFGTHSFSIQHKTFFLLGYGLITTGIYVISYAVGMQFLRKWFDPKKWNMLKELSTLLVVFNLMSLASLIYHHSVIGSYRLSFSIYLDFLKYTGAIAFVPFAVLYYQKYLITRLSASTTNEKRDQEGELLILPSLNKNEANIELPQNAILFIKSDGNYLEINYKNKEVDKKIIIRNTLNNVLAILPATNFLKIHRSYIVNKRYIRQIRLIGSNYELSLNESDQVLPLSRSLVSAIKKIIE